jgi:hypothetical protein
MNGVDKTELNMPKPKKPAPNIILKTVNKARMTNERESDEKIPSIFSFVFAKSNTTNISTSEERTNTNVCASNPWPNIDL